MTFLLFHIRYPKKKGTFNVPLRKQNPSIYFLLLRQLRHDEVVDN